MTRQDYYNNDVFHIDPERYCSIDRDSSFMNLRELKDYEENTPMTPAERYSLRMWVAQGHTVREAPRPLYASFEETPSDFLGVYRMDREVACSIQRTSADRGETRDESGHGSRPFRTHAASGIPPYGKEDARHPDLCRQLLILWDYLAGEGLYTEARDYLEEHSGEGLPLPFSLIF